MTPEVNVNENSMASEDILQAITEDKFYSPPPVDMARQSSALVTGDELEPAIPLISPTSCSHTPPQQ